MSKNNLCRCMYACCIMCLLWLAGSCTDPAIRYYNLGVEAAEREELDEAVTLWKKSLEHRPEDPEALYNLGFALLKLERYGEAEGYFRKAASLNQQDPENHWGLGKSLEMQGDLGSAKRSYDRAINIKPNFFEPILGIASCALKGERNVVAEKYATQALSLDPHHREGNLVLAEAMYRNGNYQRAYGQLLSAKKFYSMDGELNLLLGKVAYARRMYSDALDALADARGLGIATDEIFLFLGLTYFAMNQFSEAEKYYRLSIYKNKEEWQAWKGLGNTYIKMDKWNDAMDALSAAERIQPLDLEIGLSIGLVLLNTGKFEESVRRIEAVAAYENSPPRTQYYLGHAYMRLGDPSKAGSAFEKFLETWRGDSRMIDEVRELVKNLSLH